MSVKYTPKLATLAQLKSSVLSKYFIELPSDETLRRRFKDAKVPYIKTNRASKRGGGTAWWDIAAVERHMKAALAPHS